MQFALLAKYLEQLEGTGSRLEMTRILAELFLKARKEDIRLITYLVQGRLGPAYNNPDFGVADKMMVKALALAYEIPPEEAASLFRKTGDLGSAAAELALERKGKSGEIAVREVHVKLMEIASASGIGSQEKKQQLIGELLAELDSGSVKYAVRMMLSKLRTGFSDMTMLDALSWMMSGDKKWRKTLEAIFNVRADLGEVAEKVKELESPEQLNKIKVDPKAGIPVLMARAERATSAEDIWGRLGECAVEYKLDGLRIQAHKRGGKVSLFSRGLENVGAMYPEVVEGLENQLSGEGIVEGEMIAVGKNGKFLPFQETAQRKRKYNIEQMASQIPLTIFLFEVLESEGRNVMNEPNEARRELLEKIVKPGGSVELMPRTMALSAEDIEVFFRKSLGEGTEGIIAKRLDSVYQAGSRNFNWIKYKKSYDKSALADTVDAVVMGYDAGQGKRVGFGIGDFLIGVYNSDRGRFETIAKIGTGLTDDEWRRMKKEVDRVKTGSKPEDYAVEKGMEVDVWAKPAIVVEIQADEISKSPIHTAGYALRFPRLVAWREKKPEDATSRSEIERLYLLQKK